MSNHQAVIYRVRNLQIVRLEASHIRGKLAREVKAADMNNPPGRDLLCLIERVQKFDCATPDLSETAVYFHEAEAAVGKKKPRGSRERAPVCVKCEPKDNDELAHQLPSNFSVSFEARMA